MNHINCLYLLLVYFIGISICMEYEPVDPDVCDYTDDGRFGDATDCRLYYECDAESLTYGICEENSHFNPDTLECDKHYNCHSASLVSAKSLSDVTPIDDKMAICKNEQDGYTIKTGTNCRSFSICLNRIPQKTECPIGFSYNDDISQCDITNNYLCTDGICPPQGIHSFQKKNSCTEYNFCFDGVHSVRKCAAGLQFDKTQNLCVLPDVAGCYVCPPVDDPMKLITFPGKTNDQYLICHNGQVELFACGYGIQWDQSGQKCGLPANVTTTVASNRTISGRQ